MTTFSVFRKIASTPDVAVNGRVLTKPHVVELMLDLAKYPTEGRLLDPGCGEGAFAIAAAKRLVRHYGVPKVARELANRIVGIEIDEQTFEICRQNMRAALTDLGVSTAVSKSLSEAWIKHGDFLECTFNDLGLFEFVVGNPPYVRQEGIPKEKLDQYRQKFACFYDRADLYVAFFEKGLKLLSDGGQLVFICPNRFTKNKYGEKLRDFISREFHVDCVVDLASSSPFEQEVNSYPGIYSIHGANRRQPVDYFRITNATPEECQAVSSRIATSKVAYHRFDSWFESGKQWLVESPEHIELLRKLEARFVALGADEARCKVGIGVASGADQVFVVDYNTSPVEEELLMPLVTTKDISSGKVNWRGTAIINPFDGDTTQLIDLFKFPKARAYFNMHKARLQSRNVAKRSQDRWYRTIDRIYPCLQTQAKLLIPDIKAENLIVHEGGQYYPHHNLYYVASDDWDLHALRSILRSSIGKFFVWMYAVKMRGDFLRFQAQYLRRICIPNLEKLKKADLRKLQKLENESNPHLIDAVVAECYGLSDRELDVIQESASKNRV